MADPATNERVAKRFVLYLPNSELTPFHQRSPWIMLPRSFQEMGYRSTIVCARFSAVRPPAVRIIESSMGVTNPRAGGKLRSLVEPLFMFRHLVRERPDLVIVSPLRSSLFTLLPLIWLHRRVAPSAGPARTKFVLKTDWSLDPTGLTRSEAALSRWL